MRDSYLMFKEAERIISRGGSAPDYDNPQIMERLNTICASSCRQFRVRL